MSTILKALRRLEEDAPTRREGEAEAETEVATAASGIDREIDTDTSPTQATEASEATELRNRILAEEHAARAARGSSAASLESTTRPTASDATASGDGAAPNETSGSRDLGPIFLGAAALVVLGLAALALVRGTPSLPPPAEPNAIAQRTPETLPSAATAATAAPEAAPPPSAGAALAALPAPAPATDPPATVAPALAAAAPSDVWPANARPPIQPPGLVAASPEVALVEGRPGNAVAPPSTVARPRPSVREQSPTRAAVASARPTAPMRAVSPSGSESASASASGSSGSPRTAAASAPAPPGPDPRPTRPLRAASTASASPSASVSASTSKPTTAKRGSTDRVANGSGSASPTRSASSPSLPILEPRSAEPIERLTRPKVPDVSVIRTAWHPQVDRRSARVRLESSGEVLELREGDALGSLVVQEITPSAVLFETGGVEIRRRVGAGR